MQRYESYKASGIEWLGEIPLGWSLKKTKHLWREVEDRSIHGNEELLSVSQYAGIIPRTGDSRSESLEDYKKCQPDDLVINIMLAWMGGLGISNHNGIVSPAYCVYRQLAGHSPAYLGYLYRTPQYLAEFARRSKGIVPSRWRMYTEDFGQVLTLLPPRAEQDRIVTFLDQKTAEIDTAIAKKERLIELLQEQKSILINQAVTRGLNTDVPLRDSGIEWIGEIPTHWDIKRVRSVFKNLDSRRIPLSGEERGKMATRLYDYYGASGVIDKVEDFIFDEPLILIAEDGANLVMRNLRLAFIASGKYWVNNHAHILKPLSGDMTYLCHALECVDYNPLITGAAQPKLTKDAIKGVSIPFPPIDEQAKIAERISAIEQQVGVIANRLEDEILRMAEVKKCFIANAVTGQFRV